MRNVDDSRESPFYPIQEVLLSKGAKLNNLIAGIR
jgi:hypothetical protein